MHRETDSALALSMALLLVLTPTACGPSADPAPAPTEPEPELDLAEGPPSRNPFGLVDIEEDFFGPNLADWASKVELAGGDDDANAQPWVEPSTESEFESIDGKWGSRWSELRPEGLVWVDGTATLETVEDRVFIRYEDPTGEYLCEALRTDDRLVGTCINIDPEMSFDNTPWVGIVVGADRIDGQWLQGRWDYRRVAAPSDPS